MQSCGLTEAALSVAQAVASRAPDDELRNRLRALVSAKALPPLAERLSAPYSGVMAVYESQRSSLPASLSARHFRKWGVLASPFAPPEVERYLPDLKESSDEVAEYLRELQRLAGELTLRPNHDSDAIVVLSLVEGVISELSAILPQWDILKEAGSVVELATAHDLLVTRLNDFAAALSFAGSALPPME
jgi:hypothetical protein